ncbi:hypothetical protein IGI04_020081, partial [Brassica rapa subsp. trilocularis]
MQVELVDSLLYKACGVVGYHVDARYAEMEKDKLRRVNQEACGVVETMWTRDAELAWDKLEEQVYTVEKRQDINLGSNVLIDIEVVHIHVALETRFQEHGDHYKRAMESSVFHKTLAIIIEE